MDKKAKKKIDVIQQRLAKLRQQLSGARRQADDESEIRRLQQEVASLEAQLQQLKSDA